MTTDRHSTEGSRVTERAAGFIAREFTYRASKARKKMWSGTVIVEINGTQGSARTREDTVGNVQVSRERRTRISCRGALYPPVVSSSPDFPDDYDCGESRYFRGNAFFRRLALRRRRSDSFCLLVSFYANNADSDTLGERGATRFFSLLILCEVKFFTEGGIIVIKLPSWKCTVGCKYLFKHNEVGCSPNC